MGTVSDPQVSPSGRVHILPLVYTTHNANSPSQSPNQLYNAPVHVDKPIFVGHLDESTKQRLLLEAWPQLPTQLLDNEYSDSIVSDQLLKQLLPSRQLSQLGNDRARHNSDVTNKTAGQYKNDGHYARTIVDSPAKYGADNSWQAVTANGLAAVGESYKAII